jgi:hypothetical protein
MHLDKIITYTLILCVIGYLVLDRIGIVLGLTVAAVGYFYQKRNYKKLAELAQPEYFGQQENYISEHSYSRELNEFAINIARHKALLINYLRKDQIIKNDLSLTDFEDGFWVSGIFETDVDIYADSFLDALEPLFYLSFHELKGKSPWQFQDELIKAKKDSRPAIEYYFSEYNTFFKKFELKIPHPYWLDGA